MKRDKVDALFSRYIRLLCNATCTRCGKYHGMQSQGLHSAHCFSRRKLSTRFYRENCTALCRGCHSYLDGHPLEKQEFFRKILGNIEWDKLCEKAGKPTKIDIKAIESDLKEKIKRLGV